MITEIFPRLLHKLAFSFFNLFSFNVILVIKNIKTTAITPMHTQNVTMILDYIPVKTMYSYV